MNADKQMNPFRARFIAQAETEENALYDEAYDVAESFARILGAVEERVKEIRRQDMPHAQKENAIRDMWFLIWEQRAVALARFNKKTEDARMKTELLKELKTRQEVAA